MEETVSVNLTISLPQPEIRHEAHFLIHERLYDTNMKLRSILEKLKLDNKPSKLHKRFMYMYIQTCTSSV